MSYNREHCLLSQNKEDTFILWLVETLSPVLLGSKPAELLSFSNSCIDSPEKIDKIIKHIGQCRRITYKIFKFKNNSTKVLFYNSIAMDNNLRDYKNRRFLEGMGYPSHYSLEGYIELLIAKMKDGEMPHEIGVFLGYPLKDILGFIGHPSLKLTKVNGWRVYGDPKLSDEKHKEFAAAKDKMKGLLQIIRPESILLSF